MCHLNNTEPYMRLDDCLLMIVSDVLKLCEEIFSVGFWNFVSDVRKLCEHIIFSVGC